MITTNMKTINTLIKTIIIKFINVKFILVIIKFSFKGYWTNLILILLNLKFNFQSDFLNYKNFMNEEYFVNFDYFKKSFESFQKIFLSS